MISEKFKTIRHGGDPIKDILFYWLPEMLSNTMLVALPPLLDLLIISKLHSTNTLGATGTASDILHTLIKLGEAIPVASIAIIGRHNGAKQYKKCGEELGNTFWTTALIGLVQFVLVFTMATPIFRWIGVTEKMILQGAPFLKLRSVGILLTFISLGFFAFMRGIKNTKTPMVIYAIGISIFIFFDYSLVLGKFGFNAMGLTGSAIATIIQYIIMIIISVWYILLKKEYKKYFSELFIKQFNKKQFINLLNLSWPIMIDKSSLALSYVWLGKMIAPLGKYAITSYGIIKNLDRFAFLPAIGFAQIVVFLVSNQLGAKNPEGAKSNIKKVMILSALGLSISLAILCTQAPFFIKLYSQKAQLTSLAIPSLVFISMLLIFDFVQLILAGALRGAGDVRTVMIVRFCCCLFFFVPLSYFLSGMNIENKVLKFVLVYGSFYVNTGLMGLFFLRRIRSSKWQNKKV